MYQNFYGLSEVPFSIAPNPSYLYLGKRHQEALHYLTYGLSHTGGFILLTGEVGTGKTTLSRHMLANLPEATDTAFVLNPALTEIELLETLCDELKIQLPKQPTLKQLTDHISQFLLENHQKGRHTVLIIDEAQHLLPSVLEQLRLLTNLETDTKKLLQIILIGQPELNELLRRKNLRQLAQRITARYHLLPLTQAEVNHYISHRLSIAGRQQRLFSNSALKTLFRLSQGVPRIINLLAERALMAGYATSAESIDAKIIHLAAAEVLDVPATKPRAFWQVGAFSASCLLAGLSAWLYWVEPKPSTTPITQTAVAETAVAETAVAETAEPATSDPETLKTLFAASMNKDTALTVLMQQWGLKPYVGMSPCQAVKQQEHACYKHYGNLKMLQELNHPALVHMRHEQRPFYATLLKSEPKRIQLQLHDRKVWVTPTWFDAHFTGSFEVIWVPKSGMPRSINHHSPPQAIEWLDQQLSALQHQPLRASSSFDTLLKQKLKQFQYQHGLHADGIAGQHTLILMSMLLAKQGPRLTEDLN